MSNNDINEYLNDVNEYNEYEENSIDCNGDTILFEMHIQNYQNNKLIYEYMIFDVWIEIDNLYINDNEFEQLLLSNTYLYWDKNISQITNNNYNCEYPMMVNLFCSHKLNKCIIRTNNSVKIQLSLLDFNKPVIKLSSQFYIKTNIKGYIHFILN